MLFVLYLGGSWVPDVRAPDEKAPVGEDHLKDLGNWLAQLLSAGLCVVVVWVMARAAAFDLLVRVGQPRVGWMWLLALVALALTAAGAVFLYRPCRRTGHLWKATTLVALALLWGTMLLGHPTDVVRPLDAGTVAVLMDRAGRRRGRLSGWWRGPAKATSSVSTGFPQRSGCSASAGSP